MKLFIFCLLILQCNNVALDTPKNKPRGRAKGLDVPKNPPGRPRKNGVPGKYTKVKHYNLIAIFMCFIARTKNF
jgi:hypothetical protein